MTAPDTTAIRAKMAALDGHTPGPWDWEVSRSSRQVELCGGKNAHDLTVMSFVRWGMNKAAPVFWFWRGNVSDEPKRADALATPAPGREHHADWFQRIDHPDARLIAAAPDMRDTILALCDALDELRAENNRLRTIIDNLHAVEEKHRETANAEFHRANRLQVDNERLTKERDEARAQVAATYGSAADALQNVAENWGCGHNESRLCDCARDAEQWSFAADEVRSMTPDDAKAALEAYGREKVREGMQRAADIAYAGKNSAATSDHRGQIKRTILAEMETLK